jgi:hypothetical protein
MLASVEVDWVDTESDDGSVESDFLDDMMLELWCISGVGGVVVMYQPHWGLSTPLKLSWWV